MERRRGTRLGASMATAMAVLLLGACGGGSEGGDDAAATTTATTKPPTDSTPTEQPTSEVEEAPPSSPAAGAQPDTNLEEVVLKPGDLAEFQITESPGGNRDTPPTKASPATCQPVENFRLDAYAPEPSTTVRRLALATSGDYLGTGTTITLAAFGQPDAEQIMSDLRDAVAACAKGYSGGALTFTEVRKLTPVDIGDEAVSFHLTGRANPTSYTVVRQGSVLVRFSSAIGTGKEAEVPQPVVVQQVMKLMAALD
ncbi:hypothetical protein [Streptomyces sp. NPDC057877]|uniref:hypothetical protein n=1 Tax=Streptomyces sp. NPDC057877 TaxID=3346269 RepID=UPI003684610A